MADKTEIAKLWTDGLSAPDDQHKAAVAQVLADGVATVNPLGRTEGKDAVLAAFGRSQLAPMFAEGKWSDATVDGDVVTRTCNFPAGGTFAGSTIKVTVDDSGRITNVETGLVQPPAQPNVPSDQVLRWATEAVGGTSVVSIESLGTGGHRASGTFRLRIEGSARATDVLLKVPVLGWISPGMVVTNARALQLAERHGLAAPRLIAADVDDVEAVLEAHRRAYRTGTPIDYQGSASGTVATLETFLPGTAAAPETVSVARLREAGAALARVHAFSMEPQPDLPYRPRPCAVDDRAAERRRGSMPTTPLLQEADERVRSHDVPAAASVFLHGDMWSGNMLFEGDRCVALIDWKTAGVGDPGVDLSNLRLEMMARYGQDAPAHVLEGWEQQSGRAANAVAYWDAVAALNTPTVMDDAPSTERRDTFLRNALERLAH